MILHDTILKRLKQKGYDTTSVHCGYLSKLIETYPEIFPKYMRENNYVTEFNSSTYAWVHRKGKIFRKVNHL